MPTVQPAKSRRRKAVEFTGARATEGSTWAGIGVSVLAALQAYQATGSKTAAAVAALSGLPAMVLPK